MKLSRAIGAALALLFFTSGFAQQSQPATPPAVPTNENQQEKARRNAKSRMIRTHICNARSG